MPARIVSIQVGRPRQFDGEHPWTTSFFRQTVAAPVRLGRESLEGDEVADPRVHGGPDKAVCVYSADNFPGWRRVLARDDVGAGAFGENFTITGLTELDVAIGDQFQIGDAVVEVSQPRGPCWKLGRRWERPDLPKLVVASGRSGWYFRVRRQGVVAANAAITLVERAHPAWTIARVNDVTYRSQDEGALRELAALPSLAPQWQRTVLARLR
ncbi:MAG TPA: MOSC domain-containing protein [Vicinamibacterales bacterium]|nr:MOSC domain-containing protein [Vicinamibacterales bacterium]